ncbi:MAG TPA: arginase family protein [Opitutaceae bacterium]
MFTPHAICHTRPAEWPEIDSGRFAATIVRDPEQIGDCAVALLGLPDDTGVRLNNGRAGAAAGPAAFRAALARYGAAEPMGGPLPRVFDAGDIEPADTLEKTHERVTAATAAVVAGGLLPVAIGGGHDLTWPFVRAVAQAHGPLTGVYFDAHLDVRESPGSGMAFRRLLETGHARALTVHGLSSFVNSRVHAEWFIKSGGTVASDSLVKLPEGDALFVSFDLDVLDAAQAPGVSAPNPAGWNMLEAVRWVQAAGADPRTKCFDVMELNPRFDVDARTARAAAHLFLTFLRGFAQRKRGAGA